MQADTDETDGGTRFRLALTIAGLVSACLVAAGPAPGADVQSITITGELKVFDGDTLEVGPLVIHLQGIDTPELAQNCGRPDGEIWPCGKRAAERLIALLAARDLSCEGLVGGQDVGARLVDEGLAWAFVEYSGDYIATEAEAKAAGQGVWQAPTQTAWDYRADRCLAGRVPDQGQYQRRGANLTHAVVGLLRADRDGRGQRREVVLRRGRGAGRGMATRAVAVGTNGGMGRWYPHRQHSTSAV